MAESSTKGKLSDVVREQEDVTPLYNPFSEPDEDSDIVLRVEGTDLHVIKCMLSRTSPVLRAMFKSNFKEKGLNVVNLPEKKLKDFIAFLCEIYPDLESQMTTDNVLQILIIADEYQVSTIISRADEFLLTSLHNRHLSSLDLSMLKVVSNISGLHQAQSYLVEELSLQPSSELDYHDVNDKFLKEIFQKRLGIIETCMEDVIPVFKYLLWQVYSAQAVLSGKYICEEHKIKDDFCFLSKCDKCKALFKTILRGYFQKEKASLCFKNPQYTFLPDSKTFYDLEKPIVGTPFRVVNGYGYGQGWSYLKQELGVLIEQLNKLNL